MTKRIRRSGLTAVGVVALVAALVGADDTAQEQSTTITAGPPAVDASYAQAWERRAAHADRRQQVSRSYTREPLTRSPREAAETSASTAVASTAVARAARARQASIEDLRSAVERRSDRLREERQRERQRQRELARQRRLANQWTAPLSGYQVTATFGAGGSLWSSDHTGIDLAAAEGTAVGSVAAGEVTFAGYDGAYGNKVVVRHDDGTSTWYCHLSAISVGVGEAVGPGTTVGALGATGNVTGAHLHLETHPSGSGPVDPSAYLAAHGVDL